MICPDTTFLLDYLDEDRSASADAKAYLDANRDADYRIPAVAYFEVLRGGARLRGAAGVADLRENLDWADVLAFTPEAVREAARIDGELADAGQDINLADVMIAGIVREAGGTVLTRDDHFERVAGLAVETY